MSVTFEAVFESDLVTTVRQFLTEFEFCLGEITIPIRIRLYKNLTRG